MSSEALDQRGKNESTTDVTTKASSATNGQVVLTETAERLLLSKINLAQGLLGQTARYIKLPEVEEASKAALAGKTIVMVDDTAGQLARWHPALEVATGGCAALVWHREQTAQKLVTEIRSKKPDVILLDFSLANGILGTELVSALKNALPDAKIVGFSAESSNNQALQAAGAHASAKKSSDDEDAVIREIARVVSPAASTQVAVLPAKGSAAQHDSTGVSAASSKVRSALAQGVTEEMVSAVFTALSAEAILNKTAAAFELEPYSEQRACELGAAMYRAILERLTAGVNSPVDKVLIALSQEPYYDPDSRTLISYLGNYYDVVFAQLELLAQLLPAEVQQVVGQDKLLSTSVVARHLALLFSDQHEKTRRIVTDTALIQLSDVSGYNYLDLSPQGAPFIRCCTSRGGERAFFDGERLMSHPSFRTCAPKVSFFDGGYIVNSSKCTIVNGMLYPLINHEDRVAHTYGAWGGVVAYSEADALASYAGNDALAQTIHVDSKGIVRVGDQLFKPIGIFAPSQTRTLANGFTLFDWSEFHEL